MLKGLVVIVGIVAGAAAAAPQILARYTAVSRERPNAAALRPTETPGSVTLRAGPDGHFRTEAVIAGRRVPMLVDTGATVVALSYEQGEQLGLVRGGDRFDARVSTANGVVGARRVVLREVRVGALSVPEVEALVLPRGAMDGGLLGMSFLGRLRRMEATRDRLTLER